MKKTSKLIIMSALAMIAGCSIEDPAANQEGTTAQEGDVFMGVNIAMPAITRTETEKTGEEVGSDAENKVSEVLLVITSLRNEYLLHGITTTINVSPVSGNPQSTVKAKVERTDVKQAFYDSGLITDEDNHEVNVFVFCNPTNELKGIVSGLNIGDKWTDNTYKVTETADQTEKSPIWTDGSFLMSNASIAKRGIPSNYNDWIQKYTSENTPFNFSGNNQGGVQNGGDTRGPVKVERSVARIDFRDGSKDKPRHASATEPYTYNIGKDENGNDDESLRVRLVRMAFVNMSKEFYYLRRVSDNGMPNGANFALCGQEALTVNNESNFVVDTDYEFKSKKTLAEADFAQMPNHFNFPLFDNYGNINDETRTHWYSTWIPDIETNNEDNGTWTPADQLKEGYRVWRYVTENTIPADNTNQRTSLSSGVVFKGKLEHNEDETRDALANAIKGEYTLPEGTEGYLYEVNGKKYPTLYTYEGNLYVGWNDEVRKAATSEEAAGSPLSNAHASADEAYQALVAAQKANSGVDAALTNFRKAATDAGFTLYQPSDDADGAEAGKDAGVGYYFYYYYFNRHNDNDMPGTMANMEFAVVRNNVYKLAVTDIKGLGHPRITDNDPDPIDPEEPDEAKEVYFEVQVEVLPWTVRVNNIEF